MTMIEKLIRKIESVTYDIQADKRDNDFEKEDYEGFVKEVKTVVEFMLSCGIPIEIRNDLLNISNLDLGEKYLIEMKKIIAANKKLKEEFLK